MSIFSIEMTGHEKVLATTLNQGLWRRQYLSAIQAAREVTLEYLISVTPVQSGETRDAWVARVSGDVIDFMNNHEVRGFNVISLLSSGTQAHSIYPTSGRAVANGTNSPWGPFAYALNNRMKANQGLAKALDHDAGALAVAVAAQQVIGYYANGAFAIQGRAFGGRFAKSLSNLAEDQSQ